MQTDLNVLRDETRAYLALHPDRQTDLADQIGISHSWLNKFLNGQFPNLGVPRLNELVQWVERDKADREQRGLPAVAIASTVTAAEPVAAAG